MASNYARKHKLCTQDTPRCIDCKRKHLREGKAHCGKCGAILTEDNASWVAMNSYSYRCKKCWAAIARTCRLRWETKNPHRFKAQRLMASAKRAKGYTMNLDDTEKIVRDAEHTKCVYCGETITLKNMSIDHKTPVIRGGLSGTENLQVICLRCNGRKASLTHEEFTALLKFLEPYPDMKGIVLSRIAMAGSVFKRRR